MSGLQCLDCYGWKIFVQDSLDTFNRIDVSGEKIQIISKI